MSHVDVTAAPAAVNPAPATSLRQEVEQAIEACRNLVTELEYLEMEAGSTRDDVDGIICTLEDLVEKL
jgi:hypothetical protein